MDNSESKVAISTTCQQVDDHELADKVAKEIICDIESYVENHLNKYGKYTLNAPQMASSVAGSKTKFYNLISQLRDVSILGRKLLEASPRFESFRPRTPRLDALNSSEKKSLLLNSKKDSKSLMSEEDATSDDLLAALIESSLSDDFLVLSSSLDSIEVKDMMLASLILITSHECFTLSHDIQGVVMVLRKTKFMINNILAPKNQMELVTRLLTSISRYNEMNYVFDLFRDRNQFEILLSKGVEKTPELQIALFNYVKKNPEFYALVTLNFSMFREIAESLEASATKRLDKIIAHSKKNKKKKVSFIKSSVTSKQQKQQESIIDGAQTSGSVAISTMKKSNSVAGGMSVIDELASGQHSAIESENTPSNKPIYSRESLNICLVEMVDASDCFMKAGCYKRSNQCENKAKLIALQLALLQSEFNVLNLQPSDMNNLIVNLESFSEACIVANAYNYHFTWRNALFRNVILRGQSSYLYEYCSEFGGLSSALVSELVLLYKQYIANNRLAHEELTRMANSMKLLLKQLNDVELKCKIYTQLQFNDAKEELLQDRAVQAHLKDFKLA